MHDTGTGTGEDCPIFQTAIRTTSPVQLLIGFIQTNCSAARGGSRFIQACFQIDQSGFIDWGDDREQHGIQAQLKKSPLNSGISISILKARNCVPRDH
ncbi:hypothetical protein VTL71DRAFT_5119, partial [Oculimacula yallundae]